MSKSHSSPSSISRRNFLSVSGAASALFLAQSGRNPVLAADGPAHRGLTKRPIGLELYSVRTELARDLPKTLETVAKIGYEVVEFYAPYFEWSLPYAKEVRARMDDLGLRCLSTHNHIESFTPGETMNKAIELNQILGTHYIVMASSPGWAKGVEGWKRLCGQLSQATEQLLPHGLSAGYHNHQAEWAKLDGDQRIMEFIATNTPKEFVLQLDVGTCVETHSHPAEWVKANPGRIKVVHLKDWAPDDAAHDKGYKVLFGEGVTPWKELIAALESVGGVEFYLMEQEGSRFSEFETAKRCLDTWKSMRA
ncbi:TIM barrel protein [bacterium]|nr:TIM barrel protein [bacterium]